MSKHRATIVALVLLVACAVLALPIIFGSMLLWWPSGGAAGYMAVGSLLGLSLLAVIITILRRFRPK